jgi:hypothetical protein
MASCTQCGSPVEGRFCARCGAPASPGNVERSGDGPASFVEGPFLAGSQITVDADDVFVGIVRGSVIGALGPGRQVLPQPIDAGVFVRRSPLTFNWARRIGEDGRCFGTARFAVEDPLQLVAALADPRMIDGDGLGEAVTESIGALAEQCVLSALRAGTSPSEIASDPAVVFARAADQWPVPGTRIDLSDTSFSFAGSEEHEHEGGAREGSSEEDSESTSLIGAEVVVTLPGGRKAKGVIESSGYLVRFENGEAAWTDIENIDIE